MIHTKKVGVKIRNTIIKNALIYKDESFKKNTFESNFEAKYYVCHDDENYNGSVLPNLLGRSFSWVFYEYTDSFYKARGVKYSDEVSIYEGELKDIEYSSKLEEFINLEDIKLFQLFEIKKGVFENYDRIDIKNDNLLILTNSNTNRNLEIKIGRFLKTLIDENLTQEPQHSFFPFKISDYSLEEITNKFKAFNNGENSKVELVKGKDILIGYTKSNYYLDKGTLSGSCMTNKHSYLELYTNNPNIELAIYYINNKVVARCLVWEIEGVKYYDKIYSIYDWANSSLSSSLKKLGIENISAYDDLVFKLENLPEYYPYVDTLHYLDSANKLLTNYRTYQFDKKLTSQEGITIEL